MEARGTNKEYGNAKTSRWNESFLRNRVHSNSIATPLLHVLTVRPHHLLALHRRSRCPTGRSVQINGPNSMVSTASN